MATICSVRLIKWQVAAIWWESFYYSVIQFTGNNSKCIWLPHLVKGVQSNEAPAYPPFCIQSTIKLDGVGPVDNRPSNQ